MAVVDIVAIWFVVACRQKGMYRFVQKKLCVVGVVLVVFQVVCLLCCMSFPDVNVCSFCFKIILVTDLKFNSITHRTTNLI